MNLEILLQWHKIWHLVLPVILILLFQKQIGLLDISIISFLIMSVKEMSDILLIKDPILISIQDIILDLLGIALGNIIIYLYHRLYQRFRSLKMNKTKHISKK